MEDEIDVFVRLLNRERLTRRLDPLARETRLDFAAQQWASIMTIRGLTHGNFGLRIAIAYPWTACGECIAYGHSNIADTLRQWLDSPPHLHVLLGPYRHAGLGHAYATRTRRHYWCADLASPRPT